MSGENQEILFVFIAATLVFFILVAIIIAVVFLQSRKMNKLYKEKEQLLQSQLEVAENIRKQVARELHDNIGTLSSLIKINLDLIGTTPEALKKQEFINESKSLIRTLITDVKHLSLNLNSDRITAIPFSKALEEEIMRVKKLQLFQIALSITGEEQVMEADRQLILYRLCQELLHNIVKHSRASNASFSVVFEKEMLSISVEDDGIGFDVGNQLSLQGSGLINLQMRTKLIGGSLYLDSTPGKGTRCSIQIPVHP